MKVKRKGNKLLNAYIITPECVYAEFTEGVSSRVKGEMIATINYGHKMFNIYRKYRGNCHIVNIVSMLEQMEDLFRKYDYEMYELRRTEKELDG